MRPGRRRYTTAVLLAAALLVPGCEGCVAPSRSEFLEALARDNRELSRAAQAFRHTLTPLKDGRPADPGQVRQAYQEADKTLQDVKARANRQLLPASSTSAKDLLNAYKDYLGGQQNILDNFYQPIVLKVEDANASVADKWAFVSDIFQKVQAEEDKTWMPLQAAQKAYCDEHNFQNISLKMWLDEKKAGK